MRLATLLFAAYLLALSARAQTEPDTTAPHRYMPLEVGNRWEYGVSSSPNQWTPRTLQHYDRWTIPRDTVIGGQRYFVLTSERFSLTGALEASGRGFMRYDTLQAQVVTRQGGVDVPWYWTPCRLDQPFWTGESCSPSGTYPIGRGYGHAVLGEATSVKAFKFHSEDYFSFGAGVGFLGHDDNTQTYTGSQSELVYARVGTRRYGTPVAALPVVVAAEGAGARVPLALTAVPNPVTGPLTLALTLPEAGAVTVDVFDALGRLVHHSAVERSAGTHLLPLDASAWAPGLYVVRAVAGGETALLRIARH